mmetsp:Transcript_3711/g.6342  ORF Transcript_3711/g.6342 Transcript_3711/m.6342 type:complete len:112 (-) Transcript_3711:646-981(-)|eukprot:CAMPEP_0116577466 /NCGR_PEP_ID=MMETSP0397-20121206/21165_1 /TAXON_ID=216820 /ORGANISM="Cyclophora tenuis, Strain ECT3854" /LENGTH=111 /DNA_ID=CAMNT_0004106745 /DNA_START=215 /DNA_END=550 /DNA_ORIENTATION=+
MSTFLSYHVQQKTHRILRYCGIVTVKQLLKTRQSTLLYLLIIAVPLHGCNNLLKTYTSNDDLDGSIATVQQILKALHRHRLYIKITGVQAHKYFCASTIDDEPFDAGVRIM